MRTNQYAMRMTSGTHSNYMFLYHHKLTEARLWAGLRGLPKTFDKLKQYGFHLTRPMAYILSVYILIKT